MIVAHYNSANSECLATVHMFDDRDWERMASNAVASLRRLAPRGVWYEVRGGNKRRTGFT